MAAGQLDIIKKGCQGKSFCLLAGVYLSGWQATQCDSTNKDPIR